MKRRKDDNDVQTTLRLPTSLLQRIDALADQTEGPPLNRSDVLRLALERGLDVLAEGLEKQGGTEEK